jgi:hypothetical protein
MEDFVVEEAKMGWLCCWLLFASFFNCLRRWGMGTRETFIIHT